MTTSQQVPHLAVPGANTPSPPTSRPGLTRENTRGRTATTQRLPPPVLFQGPPSKNASHISLALPGESHKDQQDGRPPRPSRIPPASSFSGPSLRPPPTQADDFHAENLWAEMQKTLADVELSAMNPSHVFGKEHSKALEDLRKAQLNLAQAWAKSEADEIVDNDLDNNEADNIMSAGLTSRASPGRSKKNETATSATSAAFAGGQTKDLEEETERDIRLARKRREANDRYFQQVNQGVLEVVSKLDEVATAMRRVEKESRDLWEDAGSDGDGSVVTGTGDELESRSPESPETPMERRRR